MKEKYIKIKNLSISEKLLSFVNNELLPNTKLKKENFWDGFDKAVHKLATKNKELLEKRDELQKKIDEWHKKRKGNKFNIKEYTNFLKKNWLFKKIWPRF
jgi:malate synthase